MPNTIILTFNDVDAEKSEIIIALLESAGFEAFEERENQLIACIAEPDFDEAIVNELLAPLSFIYKKDVSAPRNWNAEWEQQYQPVIIENFAGIRADFHVPLLNVQYEIIITPKMSFGTGHHATTKLMMMAMQEMDFTGKKVFDFGTGTGVLAILSSMLKAAEADAMDIDDWVVENAKENVERNQIDNIHVSLGNAPVRGKKYDVILANINRHILLEHMNNMRGVLEPEGYLLMSGFYEADIPVLETAAKDVGFVKTYSAVLDNWACTSFQLR